MLQLLDEGQYLPRRASSDEEKVELALTGQAQCYGCAGFYDKLPFFSVHFEGRWRNVPLCSFCYEHMFPQAPDFWWKRWKP